MNIQLLKQIRKSWETHNDKPEETPESTLRALYFLAVGEPVSVVKAKTLPLPHLNQEECNRLVSLVEQRCSGIPLAHLTGRQQFMGIEMLAGPEAMIPRKETEILGNKTLALARSLVKERGRIKLLDVCSGSGNLILGVIAQEPNCKGFGSDLSFEAVEFAKMNARHLSLEDRVEFKQGNLFGSFNSDEYYNKIDIITCNPPYISSKKVVTLYPEISKHESSLSFDGGPFGLTILARLIREAHLFLKSNSFLCFEVGIGQGAFVERMLTHSNQYCKIEAVFDDNSEVRVLVASTK